MKIILKNNVRLIPIVKLLIGTGSLLLHLAISGIVSATPIYSVSHNSDAFANTGPHDTISQGTAIDYSFNGSTYFLPRNTGIVSAQSGQGFVGISAVAINNGIPLGQRQEVVAGFSFDVIFGSAGNDPIDIAMNLMLSGEINIGSSDDVKSVFVGAGVTNLPLSTGDYVEASPGYTGSIGGSGILNSFIDNGADHLISTNIYSVAVNVPVNLQFLMKTSQTYGVSPGSISFGDTLSLSTVGDVFTIFGANGITVNSVDAGIVNNRYGAATVPEPATLSLFLMGLIGLGGMARWRKR